MRVQPWFVAVVSVVLLSSIGREASAQTQNGQSDGIHNVAADTASSAMVAPTPIPGYPAAAAQPPGEAYLGGYPAPINQWPGLSVYDDTTSQHLNQGGLWYRDSSRQGRDYFFDLNLILTRRQKPAGIVGNENAEPYIDLFPLDGPVDIAALRPVVQGDPDAGYPGFNYYNPQDISRVGTPEGIGVDARWGFFNPDDSGFALTFQWVHDMNTQWNAVESLSTRQPKNTAIFKAGLDSGDPETFDYGQLTFDQVLQQNLMLLGGLPLNDDTLTVYSDGNAVGGVTSPYDLEFTFKFKSERYGAGMVWYLPGGYRGRHITIQPFIGLKYLYLQETFSFIGRDSGLLYDTQAFDAPVIPDLKLQSVPDGFDQDGNGIIDDAGALERFEVGDDVVTRLQDAVTVAQDDLTTAIAIGDSNLIAQAQQRLQAAQDALNQALAIDLFDRTAGRFIPIRSPFTAYLNNEVNSHMAGPEIGLRFDVGRNNGGWEFWGESRFALMANHERILMDGDNIGMSTRPADFLQATPENPRPNMFTDSQTHTHVSPLFEQSFFLEAPIFSAIPLLKRLRVLDAARFRAGYTITYIGSVTQPSNSIRWDGNPSEGLFPTIDVERDRFFADQWTFGVNWQY